MDLARERLALEHLEDALTWPPEEREQRLREALKHDPRLLKDVRELLLASQSVNHALPTALPMSSPEPDVPPPEQIGPYRVRELLGQGGMGSVYRAERADGAFERSVAIKLMRRTRAPELVAAQFARERSILAGLQHRNIAQLLDAGVTSDGRSYFVMELVSGRLITQYATERQLSLHDTLELFLQVCSAVRFAHARLVVHADIKPTNILVGDDGTAKLLDFGVARMLAGAEEVTEGSATASETDGDPDQPVVLRLPVALTPGYASPSRQRGEPPATADDVFSLGVLLHDLLERFPDAPADLRASCDRARAADVNERYPSVEMFQADLERWLASFPVQAYRGDWGYVARKFVARHRVGVFGAGVAVVFLTGTILALAFMYTRAEHARASAEERFADLRALSRFVLFDVYDRLESIPRALPLRGDLAEAAQGYLDRLARDPGAPPAVRLEVIEGLRRLAQVQASPGAPSVSNAALARRNLDRAEAMAKAMPDDAVSREDRAVTLARLELARARLAAAYESDYDAAHRALDRATAQLDNAEKLSPPDAETRHLRIDIEWERADSYQWQGKYADSMKVAGEALSQLAAEEDATPKERKEALLRRTRLLDIYAESLYYTDKMEESEKAYRQAMELLKADYVAEPDNPSAMRRFMRSEWALGEVLLVLNRAQEAEPMFAQSTALYEKLHLLEPRDRDLARTGNVISVAHARALAALGRHREALPLLERSVAERRRLWDEAPDDMSAARDYAIGVASLAEGRAAARLYPEACSAWAESMTTFDRIRAAGKGAQLDEDHTVRIVREEQAKHCSSGGARGADGARR